MAAGWEWEGGGRRGEGGREGCCCVLLSRNRSGGTKPMVKTFRYMLTDKGLKKQDGVVEVGGDLPVRELPLDSPLATTVSTVK